MIRIDMGYINDEVLKHLDKTGREYEVEEVERRVFGACMGALSHYKILLDPDEFEYMAEAFDPYVIITIYNCIVKKIRLLPYSFGAEYGDCFSDDEDLQEAERTHKELLDVVLSEASAYYKKLCKNISKDLCKYCLQSAKQSMKTYNKGGNQ